MGLAKKRMLLSISCMRPLLACSGEKQCRRKFLYVGFMRRWELDPCGETSFRPAVGPSVDRADAELQIRQ
uniref:Putative secreted protein n=1 Tax=Anopheles darlingi TaxID=43151 RepID=A0A2M4DNB9_ANODA